MDNSYSRFTKAFKPHDVLSPVYLPAQKSGVLIGPMLRYFI